MRDQTSAGAPAKAAGSPFPGRVILAVDDVETNLALIEEVLEPHGADLVLASSGEEGIRRAREKAPDLVLLDLMMPGLSGFDVCRILKSDEQLATIPVIFLTAAIGRAQEVEAFQVGAVDYITKPVSPEVLVARVATQLRLVRAREDGHRAAELAGAVAAAVAMAHEVNNPLQALVASAELLLRRRDVGAEARDEIERISTEAWRIRDVVARMNRLVKPVFRSYAPGIRMVDLNEPES